MTELREETGIVERGGALDEARRQLRICNACRYCEGQCAAFRAITRRRDFDGRDILRLANLCHDCRAVTVAVSMRRHTSSR